ncbi:DUF72 domain-containing protein [Pseudoduganella sp. LjRoot289]|uniref:DUF72 domain-containing protein n=1 Tax=Pseudoduganella sp. LjRoot289 TaxID=3342314 RepID=UPI003ED03DC4
MAVARIGCAGSSIPRAAAESFPAEGSHLERYAAVLNALEINSSFYRPHKPAVYERWAASVPDTFAFAVKAPKAMTHERRLHDCAEPMRRFAAETAGLGSKLACVLVQLPPSLQCDPAAAPAFFALAKQHFGCMLACEARHPTWFEEPATAMLTEAGITRVIADPPKGQPGPHVATTAATYVRLHGSPRIYYSPYEDEFLDRAAVSLAGRVGGGSDAWCIFDNTASGAAVPNAVALMQRLAGM